MIARIVAVLIFVLPSVAFADQPDPLLMLGRLQPAHDRWLRCAAAHAKEFLGTRESADVIAEAAFKHCHRQERTLRQALQRELGKSSVLRVLEAVRSQDRSSLIEAIENLRAK
jgi:hypothetical protein